MFLCTRGPSGHEHLSDTKGTLIKFLQQAQRKGSLILKLKE